MDDHLCWSSTRPLAGGGDGPRGGAPAAWRQLRRWCAIELSGTRRLNAPLVIAAFEGWNDAGEAASGAITHLSTAWDAVPLAEIDPEDYYDFQVTRPTTEVTAGTTQRLTWPTTRLLAVDSDRIGRDVVLVQGIEPNMRWRRFCAELVEAFTGFRTDMVVLLGALLADSPHTRPVPVTATSSHPELVQNLRGAAADYKGPTGIVGVLQHACGEVGIKSASLWAAVPHYVAQPPSPKATVALLHGVEDLLDVSVPLGDLPAEARAWERGVDELAEQDSEVAEYVRTLEEAKDATDLPEASGDAIAAEFERYLRRRDHGERGGR
ncbi:MAG TPA: PAC2 family protein [Streptosporangiaceae bacterium]|nr:PAC2 family protein [Streptosporangiaceae bacterium]